MNIVVEEEEDDPQTKFYKQHMRRSERPPVRGRSTNYNFDEWTQECITKSFNRKKEFKETKAREERLAQTEAEQTSLVRGIFGIGCIAIGIYVIATVIFSADSDIKLNDIKNGERKR